MRALAFVLLSAIALTATSALASTRGTAAEVTNVSTSCPSYEGYPDCTNRG
jgi:hypothetical protein